MPAARRLPPPWTVEEYRGMRTSFATPTGSLWRMVYFASELVHTRYLMTKDEARTIAATILKLPELLKR